MSKLEIECGDVCSEMDNAIIFRIWNDLFKNKKSVFNRVYEKKVKGLSNAEFSTYYFHMKKKILIDFQMRNFQRIIFI